MINHLHRLLHEKRKVKGHYLRLLLLAYSMENYNHKICINVKEAIIPLLILTFDILASYNCVANNEWDRMFLYDVS